MSSKLKRARSSGLYNTYFETVILPHKVLKLLNIELAKIIGERAAYILNYQQGKKVGKALVYKFKNSLSVDEFKKITNNLIRMGVLSGLATKVYYKRWYKNRFVMRIKSTISDKKRKAKIPTCSYISGEFLGVAETLTGKKWSCKETKCISLVDDYDEFVLSLEKA